MGCPTICEREAFSTELMTTSESFQLKALKIEDLPSRYFSSFFFFFGGGGGGGGCLEIDYHIIQKNYGINFYFELTHNCIYNNNKATWMHKITGNEKEEDLILSIKQTKNRNSRTKPLKEKIPTLLRRWLPNF
jgi:hypothetical protein